MIPFSKLSLPIAALTLMMVGSLSAAEGRAPNLIVIMTDDQGYADAGFNGCKDIPTPHMDRLAAGGAVCTSAYVTGTVCAPSRAGFITGRYPQRFGFERNVAWQPGNPATGIAIEETTIAAALRPYGYKSGLVGKWHLGSHDNFHPLNRGFDEFYGHLGGGHRNMPGELTIQKTSEARNEPESYLTWLLRGFEPVRTERYLTEELTREALEFVRRHKDKPFFLFLAYNAPHAPLQATDEDLAKFKHLTNEKRRTYAAMLTAVDRGVGQILDLLDELKVAEDTLIVFLADNGGPLHSNGSNNGVLRGNKGQTFEGGFRVPFAIRWPGKIPAGLRYDQPVSSLDIFATIAAANKIPVNAERPLDGVDLVPYLRGDKTGAPHERIYIRQFDSGTYAMREGDYKIVKSKKDATPALYHLTNDPSERTDLAAQESERLNHMQASYDAWNAKLIEPAFPGLDMREWQRAENRAKP
ncbi:MAG: sulfatase-like hydrolase/transferase [Candidatus Methylacidiphilales bacterium]|nr:sulfatase-like hydrolase/transferase [Candidatus Methylacidiphilales bacterium]